MKKVFVIVFLMFIVYSMQVNAQLHIGFQGSMNIATFDMDPDEGVHLATQTFYGFGGFIDVKVLESFSVCSEPMYLQKGSKWNDVLFDWEYTLSYLDIPVLFKYDFVPYENDLYILAGPTFSYCLDAEAEYSTGSGSEEIDVKDQIKDLDFGISFGGGGSVPMGNWNLFFEARYCLGLTNIYDNPEDPDREIKTKGLLILAGVYFPL